MEDNIVHLQNLGLTAAEARTYIALQEIGESKTGEISLKSNIPTSHLYNILNSLIKKGLVNYKYSNKVKIFQASTPESLEILYKNKKQELESRQKSLKQVILNLSALPKEKETISDYQYFEGISGLKAMWIKFYNSIPKDSKIEIFGSKTGTWERMNAVYLDMHRIRKKRNSSARLLIPSQRNEEEEKSVKKLISERMKIGMIDIRMIDTDNVAEFVTSDNILVIQDTSISTPIPRGFMIKDKIFIDLFRVVFDQLWNIAKS
tara:strand:+ start:165 stop:950 length:786 start_codon:yes stop_codon:yes gene_type:complete